MAKSPKPSRDVAIELPPLDIRTMQLVIIGDSPLICHAWSLKAKKLMLDKQMKRAKGAKEAKNPEQDYQDSLYRLPDGRLGFPVVAFKAAAIAACRYVEGVAMTQTGAFHVVGELVPIEGEVTPREDMVRLETGVADFRFRGEFKQWRTVLTIRYNAGFFSAAQIVNLFANAGFQVGVGEWRPGAPKNKSGSNGLFHVATADDLKPKGKAK